MAFKNKADKNAYQRRYYHSNDTIRREHIERVTKNKRRYYTRNKAYIDSIKKAGCILCGEKELCCLSFHHLKDKKFPIAKRYQDHSLEQLKREIAKCVILCENCHRKVHARILVVSKQSTKDYIDEETN